MEKIKSLRWADITSQIAFEAFQENVEAIEKIPKKFIDLEMVEKALEKNPALIKFVPERLISPEIARKVMDKNPSLVSFLPNFIVTSQMIMECVRNFSDPGFFFKALLTWEMKRVLLEENIKFVEFLYLEDAFCTQELADEIWNAFSPGKAIQQIPNKFITSEMIHAALDENIENIEYIPVRLLEEEHIQKLLSFGKKGRELAVTHIQRHMGKDFLTKEVLDGNPWALEFIDIEHITQEMVEAAFAADVSIFRALPYTYKTWDRSMEYLNAYPDDALRYIPEKFHKFLAMQAIIKCPSGIGFLKKKYITKKIAEIAFKDNPENIRRIPQGFI